MKIFLLYFQFFLFSIYIFSQSPRVAVTSVTSGYQVNSLNGYGFENNNLTTISNISNSNPSLIPEFDSFSFGISKTV